MSLLGLFKNKKTKKVQQPEAAPVEQTVQHAEDEPLSSPTNEQVQSSEPATQSVSDISPIPQSEPLLPPQSQAKQSDKVSWFKRLTQSLGRTRSAFGGGLSGLFSERNTIDDTLLDELETTLLTADVGIEATDKIIASLTAQRFKTPEAFMQGLQDSLYDILAPVSQPLAIDQSKQPYVILMVGVNGAGKTTTIGKLAQYYKSQGLSVMLAAGDTFRAAAVEQLQVWGERNNVPVVAQHTGADSASVIFDTVQAAKSRNVDVVIADTAGRLHTKSNLMAELEKIVRVMKKLDTSAPHEIMLVLDAGMGQNALSQAQQFHQAVGVTGITLTKLDGTAKGGIIFAIAQSLAVNLRFIGVGEQVDDLRPFDAQEFVAALFVQ